MLYEERSSSTRRRTSLAHRLRQREVFTHEDTWSRLSLAAANRIAVVDWPEAADATSVTVVGYETNMTDARATQLANLGDGSTPQILFNNLHADFPKEQSSGNDLDPEWYAQNHTDNFWV